LSEVARQPSDAPEDLPKQAPRQVPLGKLEGELRQVPKRSAAGADLHRAGRPLGWLQWPGARGGHARGAGQPWTPSWNASPREP